MLKAESQRCMRLLLLFFLLLGSFPTLSVPLPEWTYTEQDQPGGWGAIVGMNPVPPYNYPYAECAVGSRQSPMALSNRSDRLPMEAVKLDWLPFQADFFNPGHALQVQPAQRGDPSGRLKIGRASYPFIQLHVHSPSEHSLEGRRYEGEVHFVHVRADGELVVVAVFLEIGKENPAIEQMLQNEPNTPGEATHHPTRLFFDPRTLLPPKSVSTTGQLTGRYFRYEGSLTTPPCTEGVSWIVLAEPAQLSPLQLQKLRSFFVNNTRVLQDARGRVSYSNRR